MSEIERDEKSDDSPLPFVAGARNIPLSSPFKWLKMGVEDMKKAPFLSIGYGMILTLVSLLIAYASYQFGTLGLYLGLASGFLLVGPVLAIGLYSLSCQIEQGRVPKVAYCVKQGGSHARDILIFSFVFLIVFMIWARAATALHIFFPENADYAVGDLVVFLGIGAAIGAIFSSIVFIAGAFSLPMIMDREADAITAVISSANAVLRNKLTMLVWGGIIVALVLLGFATFFIGFIFILPIIGHATWHAYRETIDASLWPENRKFGVED